MAEIIFAAMYPARIIASFIFCCGVIFTASAQQKVIYAFLKDDTTIREKYYQQALQYKNELISSLGKQYKNDYKEIYEARFEGVADLLKSSRTVSEPAAHAYLQALLKKIVDVNPELKGLEIRLVFSRDGWPNAYSTGEGTLAVNAGLFVFLDNEGQLVFTICHELAHLYLDHSNKEIRKNVELANSDDLKKQAKQLSKQQYRIGQKLDELVKNILFLNRRHSREDEAEADRQAFIFMKKTGYDCKEAKSCLQLLDKIDDTTLFKPVNLEEVFQSGEYAFRKKWIQNESSIFASMSGDDSPLTKAEKDSLRTHPDCQKRILLLEDSIRNTNGGKGFLVDEQEFNHLKKIFVAEMAEQQYRNNNLGHHLYLCLQLLQKEEYSDYAAYAVVRCLNKLYDLQKKHMLGLTVDKETRGYPADYNLVLRMLDRLRLDELANLDYYFAKKYRERLAGYNEFTNEMRKAEKIKSEN